ncbi:MAG: hypothetical protein HGB12_02965 [Bacteroidetes bacterium]|nr:hypothetical protein [Bacteroidota bacterium]
MILKSDWQEVNSCKYKGNKITLLMSVSKENVFYNISGTKTQYLKLNESDIQKSNVWNIRKDLYLLYDKTTDEFKFVRDISIEEFYKD